MATLDDDLVFTLARACSLWGENLGEESKGTNAVMDGLSKAIRQAAEEKAAAVMDVRKVHALVGAGGGAVQDFSALLRFAWLVVIGCVHRDWFIEVETFCMFFLHFHRTRSPTN